MDTFPKEREPFTTQDGLRQHHMAWKTHDTRVVRLGVVALLLIAWEIAARWFIDPLFISPPSRVLLSLATGAGKTFIAANLLRRIADRLE